MDDLVLWCSQVLGLSLLPLDFSLILPVASRLLHPDSTDNKSSGLMVKRFSTVRDTQSCSQSYMTKRRGRNDIEVSRKRKGGLKRRETDLGSTLFPKGSPQPRTPTEIHRIGLRREEIGRK